MLNLYLLKVASKVPTPRHKLSSSSKKIKVISITTPIKCKITNCSHFLGACRFWDFVLKLKELNIFIFACVQVNRHHKIHKQIIEHWWFWSLLSNSYSQPRVSARAVVVEEYSDSSNFIRAGSVSSVNLFLIDLNSQLLSTWSNAADRSINRTNLGFFILLVICCTLFATNMPSVVPLDDLNPCCWSNNRFSYQLFSLLITIIIMILQREEPICSPR